MSKKCEWCGSTEEVTKVDVYLDENLDRTYPTMLCSDCADNKCVPV